MPSNSDNFLQIELSGISSSCGFEDVYFSLNDELSEYFTSEYSYHQVLTFPRTQRMN